MYGLGVITAVTTYYNRLRLRNACDNFFGLTGVLSGGGCRVWVGFNKGKLLYRLFSTWVKVYDSGFRAQGLEDPYMKPLKTVTSVANALKLCMACC